MIKHIYQDIQGWFDFKTFYRRLAEEMPENFNFAEVGVWKGKSLSYFVISCTRVEKSGSIYAIDHWEGSKEHKDKKSPTYQSILENEDSLFKEFLKNMEPIKSYITVIRKDSLNASMNFPDCFFDAVFIDASHDYTSVSKDLNCWYNKIKIGGLLCGHDYTKESVKSAVNYFAAIKNLKLEESLKSDERKHTNRNIWLLYRIN